jgi:hypothetical protein
MKRYLQATPTISGRYGLCVSHDWTVGPRTVTRGAVLDAPLDAAQLRALASYDGRSPEPFALADGLTTAPLRGRLQGWRCP